MILKILFGLNMFICCVALLHSLLMKVKNFGYSATTFLLMVCDLICILLIDCDSLGNARNLIMAFFINYAWMLFTAIATVSLTHFGKLCHPVVIPLLVTAVVQTVMALYCFNAPRNVLVSREVHLGQMWWIMTSDPGAGPVNMRLFSLISVASCIYIISFFFYCLFTTYHAFARKYWICIAMQVLILVFDFAVGFYKMPIWMVVLAMNPACYFTYHYIFLFSDIKLRESVISNFANEMSDGLLIYNSRNDLIYVNDLVKNSFSAEIVEGMKDIGNVEQRMADAEIVENMEVVTFRNGDTTRYFGIRKQVFGTDSYKVGTAFVLHDATYSVNRIRLMEKVNSELERASRMKSDFLANMSHELRTPMNAVIGMAEIALREENSPRTNDCLNQIVNSGKNLLNIINDILDFSKVESGKMAIIPDKYSPVSELCDIANILQTRIGDKDIVFTVFADPKLPHVLYGDHMRIRQVLINIANNAIKFTKQGLVRITLDVEKTSDEDVMLNYHVTDTGPGIRDEDFDKLFVSFQQVDSKRNRNVEGTGLGLAISKRLCEAMGGTIGVTSEYGKGSDFWFKIPQKVVDGSFDLLVDEPEKKTVFCLNENKTVTDQLTEQLGRLGVDAGSVSDISEYEPTGLQDYLFVEEKLYFGDGVRTFLQKYPDITAVVLTPMGKETGKIREKDRTLFLPVTTVNIVQGLNGREPGGRSRDFIAERKVPYTAPNAKVLIVDDAPINLTIATGLLEPLKVMCDTALSGPEAIEKLRQNSYDLVLMDHMMPGMDGIEATKEIRATIPAAADTPIIAFSANVMEDSKEMFTDAGMSDFIAKPIVVKQLISKLLEWLPEDKIIRQEAAD